MQKKTKLYEWQLMGQAGGYCAHCNQSHTRLTVDHIVPVAILCLLDETGRAAYEDEANFQLLCHVCNQFKANRLDKRNPKTREILLKYL